MEVNNMVLAMLDREINLDNFQTESPGSILFAFPPFPLSFQLVSDPQNSISAMASNSGLVIHGTETLLPIVTFLGNYLEFSDLSQRVITPSSLYSEREI